MKVTREKPGDWLSSRHTAFHSEGDHAHESFQGDFGEPHATPGHGAYPHDFSAEEALFAEELRDVFALDYDEPPAFYARALLDDEQRAPLPLGSEQKATYQVLRRLKLPRRPLFDASGYAEQRVRRAAQQRRLLRASRSPFAGVLTLLAAFLIGAVILTAPAFAAGLQLLAGHTGVQQTQSFPAGVHSMTSNAPQQLMSLLSVTTPISWLGPDAQGFVFDSIGLFGQTVWSNGPIVDVQYRNPHVLDGLETLDIREFQISSKYSAVLQVVQQGTATLTQVGNTPAVFVDGAWTPHYFRGGAMEAGEPSTGQVKYTWQTGIRSELMFEQNGVVFWITLNEATSGPQTLTQLAQALTPLNVHAIAMQTRQWLNSIGFSLSVQMEPYSEKQEVYKLVSAEASPDSGVGSFVMVQ